MQLNFFVSEAGIQRLFIRPDHDMYYDSAKDIPAAKRVYWFIVSGRHFLPMTSTKETERAISSRSTVPSVHLRRMAKAILHRTLCNELYVVEYRLRQRIPKIDLEVVCAAG